MGKLGIGRISQTLAVGQKVKSPLPTSTQSITALEDPNILKNQKYYRRNHYA